MGAAAPSLAMLDVLSLGSAMGWAGRSKMCQQTNPAEQRSSLSFLVLINLGANEDALVWPYLIHSPEIFKLCHLFDADKINYSGI